MTGLTRLNLAYNRLTVLPETIGRLVWLTDLRAENNYHVTIMHISGKPVNLF